ncbi:MAG: hypothetical protein IJ231_02335 [Clostridia bacterium]|nr:hypothetical protein [Clostridia bacterium]
MKTELNLKELEQVNGGSFFENAVNDIQEKVDEVKDRIRFRPDPVIAKRRKERMISWGAVKSSSLFLSVRQAAHVILFVEQREYHSWDTETSLCHHMTLSISGFLFFRGMVI